MRKRTVFFVSDQTGITAETLGHGLLTQFEGIDFRHVTLPFINTIDKAREAVRRINLTAQVEGNKPIVFCTFVQPEYRDVVRECAGLCLDFFDAFIGPLERELEVRSSHTTGRAHGMADVAQYTRRIDAVNYAMANDDGVSAKNYDKADIILIGVSRCGKTPTCLYLALRHGVFAANYPLTDDDFESQQLPAPLRQYADKLFGLTIQAERLAQIRAGRRPDSNYASPRQISFEIRQAEAIFRRFGVPFVDTTHTSIEEIATSIMQQTNIQESLGQVSENQ